MGGGREMKWGKTLLRTERKFQRPPTAERTIERTLEAAEFGFRRVKRGPKNVSEKIKRKFTTGESCKTRREPAPLINHP